MHLMSSAPVRIDFTGGYTDVNPFARDRTGFAVNAAISLRTCVVGRLRRDGKQVLRSDDLQIGVELPSMEAIRFDGELDILKALLLEYPIRSGVDLATKSTAPIASGVGSSAALGVAGAHVMRALAGIQLDRASLAEVAARAERRTGSAGGCQDQYASAFGGFSFITAAERGNHCQSIAISSEVVRQLESMLLLAHPGGARPSSDLVTEIMQAYATGDRRVTTCLMALNGLAWDIRGALLDGNLCALELLIQEVWVHQRALHPGIASDQVQGLLERLKQIGIPTAKALGGAGSGACLLVLCKPELRTRACALMEQAGCRIIPFGFDARGSEIRQFPGDDER